MKINKFITMLLVFAFMTIITGCGTTESDSESNNDSIVSQDTSNEIEQVIETVYADDEIVNQFITDFIDTSDYEVRDIEKGNIRTKYYLYINDQYAELLNATENEAEYFEITIYGGHEDDDVDKISNVYKEVIKTLDSTITEDEIDETINNNIIDRNNTSFDINDKISVTYYPIVELSRGYSDCRKEVCTTIYNN